MKCESYKKSYKNKEVLRFCMSSMLVIIHSLSFAYVWMNYYVPLMRNHYTWKGNTFIILIYAALLVLLLAVFDSYLSSNNKMSMTIVSLSIAVFINNVFTYFMIIVPTTINDEGIASMWPMAWLTIAEVFHVILWAFISIKARKKLFPPLPMLVISSDDNTKELIRKFNEKKEDYNIVETINYNLPLNEIEDKCKKFSNVIIGDIPSDIRNDIIKFCFDYGINSYVLPKLSDILIHNSENMYAFDTPIFFASNEGIGSVNEITKRLMDIIISFLIIVLFSWLFIIVSILIKIEDGGDIFFIQNRITKDEKEFKLIKFRSMIMDADAHGVRPTKNDDDRITRVGKFIRRFHIDELPQVFNVLVGNMSIVGPRPERKEHVIHYEQQISEFKYRLKVKGGITGLAQVYGRYNTSAYDKLKLDLIYIKDYSILLDIELMLKTLQVIFAKEHTEGFSDKAYDEMNNAKR